MLLTACDDAGGNSDGAGDAAGDAIDAAPGDGPGGDRGGDGASEGTVRLSGTAYIFGQPTPLAGLTVAIAEFPELSTVTDEHGEFSLAVPDGVAVTPFGTLEGYATMHLQTFTTAGADIDKVYFQTVNDGTFEALAAVLEVEPSADHCQLATTVNVRDIQSLTFEEFAAFGHHGVAGATASSEPPLPDPVYFDDQTIPDRTLTETTIDGGVVWTNIEPGVYTVSASHPERVFESFVATCVAGRFINANPPWGLREQ
jgi:hypothetical protein